MKKIIILLLIFSINRSLAQPCTPNTNSILFNGTSDYISMPATADLNITAEITVEAWIYPTALAANPDEGSIVCKHGWSFGEGGYVLRAGGSGILSFNLGGLDTNGNPTSWKGLVSGPGAISLNTWSHVAGTYNGDSLSLYVNGILVNTLLFKGSIVNSANYDLKIGRLADNQPGIFRYWTGNIDEARVWNRALSPVEILANMNTQIDPLTQTGLVAYWRLNDGTGTNVADLSTNNISGTLTGNGWSTNVPFTTGAPVATITPSGNTTFCDGNSIILNANTGNGLTYLWSNGNTNQNITVSTSGSYTVTISDVNNCTGVSAPLTVTVNQVPPVPTITFNGTQLICSANSGIQWYLNGSTLFNQVGQTYTPSVNGTYTVIVTYNNGCTAVSSPFILTNLGINQLNASDNFQLTYDDVNRSGLILIELPEASETVITICDMLGKVIIIVVNEQLKSGWNEFRFDTKTFSKGTYLLVAQNSHVNYARKFSIIH